VPYISKSRFLDGLQCPKLLWSAYNAKHVFPQVEVSLQAVFDQAHKVGSLAKKLFPHGIEIEAVPSDFEGAIQLTHTALLLRRPIGEAVLAAYAIFFWNWNFLIAIWADLDFGYLFNT